jgi:hypothetical protein
MKMTQITIIKEVVISKEEDKIDLEQENQGEMTLMLNMMIRMIMIQKTIQKIKRKLKIDK